MISDECQCQASHLVVEVQCDLTLPHHSDPGWQPVAEHDTVVDLRGWEGWGAAGSDNHGQGEAAAGKQAACTGALDAVERAAEIQALSMLELQ